MIDYGNPKLLVITNSLAGSGNEDRQAALASALAFLSHSADVRVAQCRHPRELPAILAGREDRRLVVAGGDGSLHQVVKALVGRKQLHPHDPIGLLPLGTGNDFARTLGIPLDAEEAAKIVLTGSPRTLDVLLDDVGGVVVNAAHVGAGAEAGQRADDLKPSLGVAAYGVGSLVAGVRVRGWRLRILVDDSLLWDSLAGQDFIRGTNDDNDRVLMVALANGSTIGGGTPLAPHAVPDDGFIDVIVSVATGPMARVFYANDLRSGDHLSRQDVLVKRGRRVSVLSQDGAFPVNADGENETGVHGRTWHLQPKAWSVLAPE